MKIKNVCYIFLAVLLCITLSSCQQKLRTYDVYVCESDSNLTDSDIPVKYNISKNTYTLPKAKAYRKLNTSSKSLSLGSDIIPLNYERTYNYDSCEYFVNSYTNTEYLLTVNYDEKTDAPVSIILGDYKYKITDKPIANNDYLLKVCTSFLSNYVPDLSIYTASTTTWVQYVDEHGVENETLSEFRNLQNDNENITYTVDFNYSIDGIKTAENISISVTSDGYLKSMSMNMIGEFTKYSAVDVDTHLCEQLISNEVATLCDIEGYEYNGYTDSKMLVILSNKLCLLSFVSPKLSNRTGDIHAGTIQLLIPISE